MGRGARIGPAALILVAMGCTDLTPPPGPSVLSAWEGALAPAVSGPDGPEDPITGNISALVRESGTEAGIGIEPFDNPDLVLDWGLHAGSCGSPGELLSSRTSYPRLNREELSATAHITDQLVRGDSYYVSVIEAEVESPRQLACGNLSETDL